MDHRTWSILLVEDDEDDYILTRNLLDEARDRQIKLRWVTDVNGALKALDQEQADALLVDYYLARETGLDLIRAMHERGYRLPVILLTGQGSYEIDVEAMQAGAADYIIKSEATGSLLERTIRYAIERNRLLAENLEQTELAVQRAEELKTVLDELGMQRALLNAIIANAPSGMMMIDTDTRIVLSNPVANRIYGVTVPLGEPLAEMSAAHLARLEDLPIYRSVVTGETFTNHEITIQLPDGEQRAILTNSAPIRDIHGKVIGAVSVFADITEHKKAGDEQRRNLAQIEVQRRLIQSREKERLRIAQDLHDGPLQSLIGMTYEVREIIEMARTPEVVARLNELDSSLQNAIRELRAFSGQLRPPALMSFGLEKALQSHLNSFAGQHPELAIHKDLASDGQRLKEEVRLALFRIYQELLTNILRHAGATEVWVSLAISGVEVELEIRDNGCGFDVPDNWVEMARKGHLGIVGVQERAQAVGGYVHIHSTPEQGTTVRVVVPLEE